MILRRLYECAALRRPRRHLRVPYLPHSCAAARDVEPSYQRRRPHHGTVHATSDYLPSTRCRASQRYAASELPGVYRRRKRQQSGTLSPLRRSEPERLLGIAHYTTTADTFRRPRNLLAMLNRTKWRKRSFRWLHGPRLRGGDAVAAVRSSRHAGVGAPPSVIASDVHTAAHWRCKVCGPARRAWHTCA